MFNALANGMGGIDWAGFEWWVQKLGVEDVEGLMERLMVIRLHSPPDEDGGGKVRQ